MPHPSDGSTGSYGGGELRALAEAMPVRVVAAPAAAPPADPVPAQEEAADLGWDGFEADIDWDDEEFSRPIGAGVEPEVPAAEPELARTPARSVPRAPEPQPARARTRSVPLAAEPQPARARTRSVPLAAEPQPARALVGPKPEPRAIEPETTAAGAETGAGPGEDQRRKFTFGRLWFTVGSVWRLAVSAIGRPRDADESGEAGAVATLEEAEPADGEEDYDIYDARSPIRSHRDAWLLVAWALVFTALVGWATHLFLDTPDRVTAEGTSVRLDDMRALEDAVPTGPASSNQGARRIKVAVIKPETLGGRARSSEDQPEPPYYLSAYADGEIVSGAYGEFADRTFVLMAAVTSARLLYPDSQFGLLLDHLQAEDPNLVDPQPVPAGTLAGIARCGESKFAERTKAVCFWADEQCMGVITWIDQPLSQAMAEFLALREQIEHQL